MEHIKIPTTKGPVITAITHRWSPRSFSDRAITTETIDTILEAGTWAFSAFNEQPWRYIVAHRGTPLFEELWSLLMPGNQPWCKQAAVLMVSMVQTTHAANGNPNPYAHHDLGAANFALMLQAQAMDVYGHVMAGYDKARAIQTLALPAEIEPVAMIALGYRDAADKLPEPFLTREKTPRSRKAVEEIVLRRD
jgi:nitroreductase